MMSLLSERLRRTVACAALAAFAAQGPAAAFCGFYVAQADSKLFNHASKVVLAREGLETAVTMASDYVGEAREFALVIPVPTFIQRKQIGVVEPRTLDHLDAYTAPRLVEYTDGDPCDPPPLTAMLAPTAAVPKNEAPVGRQGVTVEANYDVGEYDVSILAAAQSDGLADWLADNGYKIPPGAAEVLGSYIRQNMHFFVAKVNLDRMKLIGAGYLRPLQVRYSTPKFMLPLRLGTLNADGPQDLIVYALTQRGRVEAVNYPNLKLPSGMDVPLYVRDEFGAFYKALFERAAQKEHMRAVFVEYAWNMGWCDPCAAAPMSPKELVELGARWIVERPEASGGGQMPAYVTRLHVRYDRQSFPEDIAFEETGDTQNFQGRYVLRHPWKGEPTCSAAEDYAARLPQAFGRQADALASLTGWKREEIVARMDRTGQPGAR